MPAHKGVVLIIDDENGLPTKRLLGSFVETIVRHPNDVTASDLKKAKLVLVDYKLDHWPERERQATPSLMPKDGVALIAVLKSNLGRLRAAPAAFALNSGMLKALSGGGVWIDREHVIARSIDLEWVFAKGGKDASFPVSVKSLADAVARLPSKWPAPSKLKDQILSLLGVPKRARWHQSALEAIDRSSPPHEILIENSSGIAVLRWLLHTILPFPTFLLSERYLAARLRIEPRSFSHILKGGEGKRIRRILNAFEYKGVLCDFAGTRWWRAGVEHWLWEGTKGKSFDKDAIEAFVTSKFSRKVEFTNLSSPVVSIDEHLRPCDTLVGLNDAIEIKPDGWPSFSDSAWINLSQINEAQFVALVPQSERNQLGDR